jgi:hypothetical protein
MMPQRVQLECILDLDNTLVHAADYTVQDIDSVADVVYLLYPSKEDANMLRSQPVKMREGAVEFLQRLSASNFRVHVSTLSSRAYAHAVVKMIDPQQQIVTRVISRDDMLVRGCKRMSDVLPIHEDLSVARARTCIVDDRIDVWINDAYAATHVIHIVPYEAFVSSKHTCLPPHMSRGGRDNVLTTLATVLEAVSHVFDVVPGPIPVPRILACLRKTTLAGCTLVFSGLVEIGFPAIHSDAWQRAVSFGACCIDPRNDTDWATVTHFVCAKAGSLKYKRACVSSSHIYLVSPDWLYASVAHFTRAPEADFPIGRTTEPLWTQQPPSYDLLVARALSILFPVSGSEEVVLEDTMKQQLCYTIQAATPLISLSPAILAAV